LGAFLTNFSINWHDFLIPLTISIGNTFEAFLGSLIYRRWKSRLNFLRELDSVVLLFLIAVFPPVVASLIGSFSLWLNSAIPFNSLFFPTLILIFLWCGSLAGNLFVLSICFSAIYATTHQLGPFVAKSLNANLLDLVLFLSALCLAAATLPAFLKTPSKKVALVSLGTAWIIMTLIYALVVSASQDQDGTRLNAIIEKKMDAIQDRMTIYENALRSGSGLFRASSKVEPEEWKSFVEGMKLVERFPGIKGLGVILPVKKGQENAFEKRARVEWGFPNFTIKELPESLRINKQESQAPSTKLSEKQLERYIISYIEPLETNEPAQGLDIGSEVWRWSSAKLARDKYKFTISAPLRLIQEGTEGFGFLAFFPIFKDAPNRKATHLMKFEGWVYAPFSAQDFFNEALQLEDDFYIQIAAKLPSGGGSNSFSV